MKSGKTKKAAPDLVPVVYCGPTIPGVARRFTVYSGGIPAVLKEAAERWPPLMGLLIPLEQYPDAARQLRERCGNLYALYHRATTTFAARQQEKGGHPHVL